MQVVKLGIALFSQGVILHNGSGSFPLVILTGQLYLEPENSCWKRKAESFFATGMPGGNPLDSIWNSFDQTKAPNLLAVQSVGILPQHSLGATLGFDYGHSKRVVYVQLPKNINK